MHFYFARALLILTRLLKRAVHILKRPFAHKSKADAPLLPVRVGPVCRMEHLEVGGQVKPERLSPRSTQSAARATASEKKKPASPMRRVSFSSEQGPGPARPAGLLSWVRSALYGAPARSTDDLPLAADLESPTPEAELKEKLDFGAVQIGTVEGHGNRWI